MYTRRWRAGLRQRRGRFFLPRIVAVPRPPIAVRRRRPPVPKRPRRASFRTVYPPAALDLSWLPTGAPGTAIAAGNSGFDVFILGGGNTGDYDNTRALHGPVAGKFQAVTPQAALVWSTQLGVRTQVFVSQYLYLTAYPAAGVRFGNNVMTSGNTVLVAGFDMGPDGKLIMKSDGAGFIGATSANPLPLNQWVRFEFDVSTTAGIFAARLYYTPESTGPPDDAWGVTGENVGASVDAVRIGFDSDGQGPMWVDAVQVSSNAQPGPWPIPPRYARPIMRPRMRPSPIPPRRGHFRAFPMIGLLPPPPLVPEPLPGITDQTDYPPDGEGWRRDPVDDYEQPTVIYL